jgi:hypothetical protein
MIEIGQLRRWTYKHSPLPVAWEDKVFLIVEEKLRWIDRDGVFHRSWRFIIDGELEPFWRDEDIERMSEVVNENR